MKVVIVGSAHPLRGGLAAYNERLAREYISQGHAVVIYTFSLQYPGLLFPGKTQYSDQPAPDDIFIHERINSINPFNWIRVGREIRDLNPALMIIKFWLPFMGPCLGTIARIVRGNKKTKVVAIIDNIVPHEGRIGDFTLAKYFANSVDGFVAQSRSELQVLNQFDSSKPKMFAPHPLYDNFGPIVSKAEAIKKLGLAINGQYLLFFGFIRDYKGLDLLLEAMADPRIKDSYTELIIAGEFYGDPKPYLEQIDKLGIRNKIILRTDFISDDMVRYYFCAADVVVQPYKHATQSGVTQICYHFNRPMIVSNVGGLPEIVPDDVVGFVCDPEPRSIADHIVKFYSGHKEYLFSQNIKTEKLKYLWSVMTDTIKKVAGL
jgi:glycosyltransferase involved in cell wall biosynthesis